MIYLACLLAVFLLVLEYFKYKRNSENSRFQETTFFAQYFMILLILQNVALEIFIAKLLFSGLLIVMIINNMNATYKSLLINPRYKVLKLIVLTLFQFYSFFVIYKVFTG